MRGQDGANKPSTYRTKAFEGQFCRSSDWHDRTRASPGRASYRTACCNEPQRDDYQQVRWLSRIRAIESTRCERAANQVLRLTPTPKRDMISRPVLGNQILPVRRCCCEIRETRTTRKIAKRESTARFLFSCFHVTGVVSIHSAIVARYVASAPKLHRPQHHGCISSLLHVTIHQHVTCDCRGQRNLHLQCVSETAKP